MTGDITRDLAAAYGMADMNGILEIELFDQLRQVVGVGVQVIAVPGLARAAMAATIMGDTAIAARGKEKHLIFEGVRAQGPAMAKHNRLSRAPIVVIKRCPVLGLDHRHEGAPS